MALSSGSTSIVLTSPGGVITNIGEATIDTTSVYAETRDMDFGDRSIGKFIQRLVLFMGGPQPNINSKMKIILYGRDDFQRPPIKVAEIKLVDAVTRWRPTGVSGNQQLGGYYEDIAQDYREIPIKLFRVPIYKYYRLRIEDSQVNSNWAFFGFEIWGEPAGRRM